MRLPASVLAARARERVTRTIAASAAQPRHVAAAAIAPSKEPRMQLLALSTRHIADWSPDDVACAVAQVSGGSLTMAADFVHALMHDDRASGVMGTRTLGLLGLPVEWEGGEPPEWYELATEAELNKLMQWGFYLGVGIARVCANGALETWHMRWFDLDTTTGQWYVTTTEGRKPIEFGTGEWVMFAPYGALEPYFSGLWLTLAIPFLVKRYAIHDRARASEVFGSAMIVGTAPEGSSEERRQRWLTELRSLARSARVVLPEGYTIDLLEAQGQTWGIYGQALTWADEAITIAIAGQLVTTEGSTGWSRGDIHQKIALSLTKFGAEALSTCLATQYVRPVWGAISYPKWQVDPPEAIKSVSEAYDAFGKAVKSFNEAVSGDDIKLDVATLATKFGIPVMAIPRTAVKAVPIAFAPTDIAKFVTKDEGRASIGLPALPNGEGTAYVVPPEVPEGAPLPGAAMPNALEQSNGATSDEEADADIEASALYDEAVANAESFNKRNFDACRHGKKNICRICRLRRRTKSDDGSAEWGPHSTEWVAMGQPRSIAASTPKGRARFLACSIEVSQLPEEFVVFEPGANVTDHGTVYWTKRSAELVMKARGTRDVMIDLEHLSLDPKHPHYDPDSRGAARLRIGKRGELIACAVRWTDDGKRRLKAKTQRYISPAFDVNGNEEIVSILNMALTALPAMHHAPPLVAASVNGGTKVDKELLAMLGLPETATLAEVLAAIAALQEKVATAADAAGAKDTASDTADAAAATQVAAETAAGETVEQPVQAAAAAPQADPAKDPAAGAPAKPEPTQARAASTLAGTDTRLLSALIGQVKELNGKLEVGERARLMSSRAFKPWEKTFLAKQPLDVVKLYVASAPAGSDDKQPASRDAAHASADSIAAVAKATGMSVDRVRAMNGGK